LKNPRDYVARKSWSPCQCLSGKFGSLNIFDMHLIVARKFAGHKLCERLKISNTMSPTDIYVVKIGNGQM